WLGPGGRRCGGAGREVRQARVGVVAVDEAGDRGREHRQGGGPIDHARAVRYHGQDGWIDGQWHRDRDRRVVFEVVGGEGRRKRLHGRPEYRAGGRVVAEGTGHVAGGVQLGAG